MRFPPLAPIHLLLLLGAFMGGGCKPRPTAPDGGTAVAGGAGVTTDPIRFKLEDWERRFSDLPPSDDKAFHSLWTEYTNDPGVPPEDALEFAMKHFKGNGIYLQLFLTRQFQALAKSDLPKALVLIKSVQLDADSSGAMINVALEAGKIDPVSGITWLESLPPGKPRDNVAYRLFANFSTFVSRAPLDEALVAIEKLNASHVFDGSFHRSATDQATYSLKKRGILDDSVAARLKGKIPEESYETLLKRLDSK